MGSQVASGGFAAALIRGARTADVEAVCSQGRRRRTLERRREVRLAGNRQKPASSAIRTSSERLRAEVLVMTWAR